MEYLAIGLNHSLSKKLDLIKENAFLLAFKEAVLLITRRLKHMK